MIFNLLSSHKLEVVDNNTVLDEKLTRLFKTNMKDLNQGKMKSKELIEAAKREMQPSQLKEQILLFGELGWKDAEIITMLEEFLEHENNDIMRRAAITLAKLGASEEVRKRVVLKICPNVMDIPPEEQRVVAEALGLLQITDDETVGTTLLMLLGVEDEGVKRAAGKSLSEVNV